MIGSRIITVSVPVPEFMSIPRTVSLQRVNPYIHPFNYRRVPLSVDPQTNYVMRQVRVEVPAFKQRAPKSMWTTVMRAQRGYLSIAPQRGVDRLLTGELRTKAGMVRFRPPEWNRVRVGEDKPGRFKFRSGQMISLRGDPYGIVAAAAAAGFGPHRVEDAAMAARALAAHRFIRRARRRRHRKMRPSFFRGGGRAW